MLGRKTYRQEELAAATRTLERQRATWRALAAAVEASGDEDARAALAAFAPGYFGDLVVALDRPFVHRVRTVASTRRRRRRRRRRPGPASYAGRPTRYISTSPATSPRRS
jgi:hypothetical protein